MKIIITTLSVLLLSGCVDARGKALQDQYCSDKGGVYEYLGGTGVVFVGYCKDNTEFYWDTIKGLKLLPEFYPE